MTLLPRQIDLAFLVSALLHLGILFGAMALPEPPPPPPPPPLQAQLKKPPPPPAPEPIAIPEAGEAPAKAPPAPPPPPRPAAPPLTWQAAASQQLQKLNAEGLLFSAEAIAAGLEGTAVVLLVLDEAGQVSATRIEESSGHALLDRDARSAAMRLRFPPGTPGEVILPIRFRLK